MPNILITGGAGFIGSVLAEKLSTDKQNNIVIVDNLCTGSLENVPHSKYGNVCFVKGDVNHLDDIAPVFYGQHFDYVFHYAALVGVKRTLEHPVSVLNDISGIHNILELCKNTGVKRVFFSSSSEVYGEPVELPQHEHTTPLNSRLPYAIVKNVGEAYMRTYSQEFNLSYTIFRFFNTYGNLQSDDFVMTKFIRLALAGEDLTIFGDGSQTRTFCHVNDNIDATLKILTSNSHHNDTLNIGNDIETTILELAEMIIKSTGSKSKIVHLPPLPEGDMSRRKPDNTKMQALLQRPLITLENGMREVLEYYKSKA